MDEEARVRTEKTGRIGHEAVTEATYVFDRSGAQSPTDTAFSFRQAFSFGPIASKEKADKQGLIAIFYRADSRGRLSLQERGERSFIR